MNPLVDTNALEGDVLGFDFNREVLEILREMFMRFLIPVNCRSITCHGMSHDVLNLMTIE